MDSPSKELTDSAQSLLSELELIDRYGDRFSYSELMATARKTRTILQGLMAELPEDQIPAPTETARVELQRLFLDPNSFTDGLIVVILMVARSGIRQLLLSQEPKITGS